MGYSLGGGVALRTAIQHPEVVRKLVVVSSPFGQDGWYPEVIAGMAQLGAQSAEATKATPFYQLYTSLAPKPEDWSALHVKLHDLLTRNYDWSKEVAGLKMPTMIVVGDADSVRTAHAVRFFELLGGGQKDGGYDGSGMSDARLAILPGLTHFTVFSLPLRRWPRPSHPF
jgi:pimeloyl-ACP methyl ester carboxylesterase